MREQNSGYYQLHTHFNIFLINSSIFQTVLVNTRNPRRVFGKNVWKRLYSFENQYTHTHDSSLKLNKQKNILLKIIFIINMTATRTTFMNTKSSYVIHCTASHVYIYIYYVNIYINRHLHINIYIIHQSIHIDI